MHKYEKFKIETIRRSEMHGADYNPRKISDSNKKKLKKYIKEFGLLQPIVVNKNTMNVVSGHQRLDILDNLSKTQDYELNVAFVELDEEQEIKANIILNNVSVMGEFDVLKLKEISELLPEIDFINDLGFDRLDIDLIFSETGIGIKETETNKEELNELEKMQQSDKMRIAKKEYREKQIDKDKEGKSYYLDHDDYMITFVFNNNIEKYDFMERIMKPKKERYLKSNILFDIFEQKYKLIGRYENE